MNSLHYDALKHTSANTITSCQSLCSAINTLNAMIHITLVGWSLRLTVDLLQSSDCNENFWSDAGKKQSWLSLTQDQIFSSTHCKSTPQQQLKVPSAKKSRFFFLKMTIRSLKLYCNAISAHNNKVSLLPWEKAPPRELWQDIWTFKWKLVRLNTSIVHFKWLI